MSCHGAAVAEHNSQCLPIARPILPWERLGPVSDYRAGRPHGPSQGKKAQAHAHHSLRRTPFCWPVRVPMRRSRRAWRRETVTACCAGKALQLARLMLLWRACRVRPHQQRHQQRNDCCAPGVEPMGTWLWGQQWGEQEGPLPRSPAASLTALTALPSGWAPRTVARLVSRTDRQRPREGIQTGFRE